MERLRGASSISFRSANLVEEDLAVPGMAKAMAALDICNSDLRRLWNAGEEGADKVEHSVAPLASYVSDADYPAQAVEEERGGISKVTLLIDETGALKNCLVEETSGIATLDAMGRRHLHPPGEVSPGAGRRRQAGEEHPQHQDQVGAVSRPQCVVVTVVVVRCRTIRVAARR